MMAKNRIVLAALLAAACVLWAPAARAAGMPVTVSIQPLAFFVERIGGNLVDVTVMVPPGSEPHDYEPKASQMAALSRARAYVAVGVPFEDTWLPRFEELNPDMLVIHSEQGIERVPLADNEVLAAEPDGHEHGQEGGLDPHIWTSPPLALQMVDTILDGLIQADPEHEDEYRRGHAALRADIEELDARLAGIFDRVRGRKRFLVYHPSWGYFARVYGLEQIAIEEGGTEPGIRGLANVIRQANAIGAKVIFIQPQFNRRAAMVVANSIGGEVMVADPLARDWLANMHRVAQAFRLGLR